ncbi:2-aminoethylphosphonate--pyruvate transaminase [Porticoccus sp. GXU_MW_L64]
MEAICEAKEQVGLCEFVPDNPYILLTPGPLSTSKTVKATMLRDWCTWDTDYNSIVQSIRADLVDMASHDPSQYTTGLMQGSGTFAVESVIGTALPRDGKLLVLANGAYGDRIGQIAEYLNIDVVVHDSGELQGPDLNKLRVSLASDSLITHVATVHCETTTGMLNPITEIGAIVKEAGRTYIVDAMSSFGGIPFKMEDVQADFMVSSANKCIQGVPGFGFVIAKKSEMDTLKGRARSLSLDLYDQWQAMEKGNGKWRFTSPTHVVRAFRQALSETLSEGGVKARYKRYSTNQKTLVAGMRKLGFETLLSDEKQSPIITAFYSPKSDTYTFESFYKALKVEGFVIYPGKVTNLDTFRIGNIGEVYPEDIERLLKAVESTKSW